MPLLDIVAIEKFYGTEPILKNISLQLQPGEKAGLIGPNGSGKTTLLKIIAGEIEPDSGSLHLARGTKLGYLPQEPRIIVNGTLRHHLEQPLQHLFAMKQEIAALEHEIATWSQVENSNLEELLNRYAQLTALYEGEGGYQAESRLTAVAQGLGFREADFKRDLSSFSGGEKTRARLAGLLLQNLDLLLLDEPTNFLDLTALAWLEKYLRDLNSALLVVSHDRFFLDWVVTRIFALRQHNIKGYSGNYSAYQQQHNLETLSSEREYQRRQLLKTREERLVRESKGDARSKRQARSREKRLNKLDAIERPEQDKSFKFGIGCSGRSGRLVAVFDRVSKSFDDKTIFADLSFTIRWGDRVALVGPNGAGKSTLLKLISGQLQPTAGTVQLGPSVHVLYFSQEQEQLNPQHTLLEAITEASKLSPQEARSHLGGYLFRGDDVFKRVCDLSGGEKSRLALARLALSNGNCLLMDEPTSHLDLPALEELEKVLIGYPGTMIIVSHDRFFLNGLADRVIEIDYGTVCFFDGKFSEFLDSKDKQPGTQNTAQVNRQDLKRRHQEEQRHRQAEQRIKRLLQNEHTELEQRIAAIEKEIASIEKVLSNPAQYGDHIHLSTLGAQLEAAQVQLSALLQRWEEVAVQLEQNSAP